jgi:hypothetical protein
MRRYIPSVGMPVAVFVAAAAAATPTTNNPDDSLTPFPELPPKTQQKPPAIVSSMLASDAVPILGKKVLGPNDKDVVGQIVDILVDKNGKPAAAVIDVGGFLGVGSRKIAVDWQSLRFRPNDHEAPVSLLLDREQVQSAPEYKESGSATAVITPPVQSDTTNAPD